jgi:phenylalanyl-tRNA synthetase alpha chain
MADLENRIDEIKQKFEEGLSKAVDEKGLDELYLEYFSKTHGAVTDLVKELPSLESEEKRKYGPLVNKLQSELKTRIDNKKKNIDDQLLNSPLLDLSYSEKAKESGMLHPTTQVIRQINDFFRYYGYSIVEGPEIETAENNFRKLNLPEGHPATDLQDTLFIDEPNIMLRTHTSSIQSRILTEQEPPIRAAFPGKSYRNETANRINMSFFHQYQAVVVDKGINIQHLKGSLQLLLQFLFGEDAEMRFRYKYYPEVSPGMGGDIMCPFCKGKGCETCRERGWIEVVGSGMIHYNTLQMCGIDPEVYTGFAFGIGLDRLVMSKFGIDDIRKLYGEGLVYD